LTMFVALVSGLAGVRCSPSKVMAGTIGIKLDIGPVGGLGGFGSETGKLVGILKRRRARITDLLVPKINCDKAHDEMRMLLEEEVRIHPVSSAAEVWEAMFRLSEGDILERVRCRITGEESVMKGRKEKGVITDCPLTR